MHLHSTLLSALALSALAAAQTVTSSAAAVTAAAQPSLSSVSLFIPNADYQPLVASVISVSAPVTAYHINCTPGTDDTACGFPPEGANVTVNTASSVYDLTLTSTASPSFSLSIAYQCTLQGAAGGQSAVCAETVLESGTTQTTTTTVPSGSVSLLVVAVTAGAPASNSAAGATSTASGASKIASAGGASGSGSGTTAASGSKSGPSSSSSSSSAAGSVKYSTGAAAGFFGLFAVLLGLA